MLDAMPAEPLPITIHVPTEAAGLRVDVAVATLAPGLSRNQARTLLDAGRVQIDGRAPRPSEKVRAGQHLHIAPLPAPVMSAQPEAIPLAIVYEDDALVVIDKPAGLVVHPAGGHESGTLVNALLAHAPQVAGVGDALRPGLVHRIDKDTSGLLVITKSEQALRVLGAAFARHDIERRYAAIALGRIQDDTLRFDTLHGRHPKDRKRFSTRVSEGKRAVTNVTVLGRSALATLVVCRLETGRTHQIRAHLADAGWPIAGDALYGGRRPLPKTARTGAEARALERLDRQALHAYSLGFAHPVSGERLIFRSPWPPDLEEVVRAVFGADALALP